jgi:hypothetical protein
MVLPVGCQTHRSLALSPPAGKDLGMPWPSTDFILLWNLMYFGGRAMTRCTNERNSGLFTNNKFAHTLHCYLRPDTLHSCMRTRLMITKHAAT